MEKAEDRWWKEAKTPPFRLQSSAFGLRAPRLPRNANHHRGSAVEPPSFLAGVVVFRTLFAVAHCAQAIGADAARRQVLADGGCTPLAEREVVLGRADVAG